MGPGLLLQCHSSGSWRKKGSNIPMATRQGYCNHTMYSSQIHIHLGICVGMIRRELCFDCDVEG